MEDLRAQIKTKGLTDGGGPRTPLRDFWGTFEGFDPVHNAQYNTLNVKLKFSDIEVIKSESPYEFPVAEIMVKHSDRTGSLWGVFSESVNKFLAEDEELPSLVGQKLHMVYTPGHMMFDRAANNGAGGQSPRDAWEVTEVAGRGSGSSPNGSTNGKAALGPLAAVLSILNGKTEQEFNAAALRDDRVKKDSSFVDKILSRSLLGELVTSGQAVKGEDGRYKVDETTLAALA